MSRGPAYRIATARPEDIARLPAIERAAAALFPEADLAAAHREVTTPLEELDAARVEGRLWVALDPAGEAVGFALAQRLDGAGHLAELDVHPDHGRRGLGRRLLGAVVDWCRAGHLPACTLTTFRHLDWNAPFYASAGFRILTPGELTPGLARHLEAEAREGLDPARRVAMRLDLAG
ncbi:MAG: GNAT family N-acetyltransferase [Myxococcota bacterium]